MLNTETILGIKFVNATAVQVISSLKRSGGLLVVPSAPGLVTIQRDREYYEALQTADMVIPDSGYMVLLWSILKGRKLRRISGLEFLVNFLDNKDIVEESSLFLVDPRPSEAEANIDYLKGLGHDVGPEQSYIAPLYPTSGMIEDAVLLSILEKKKPRFVLINVGGGIQEKLGAYLKTRLTYRPAVICTGAAIAFLTGHQARIPRLADKLFMGWLVRCIHKPRLYVPRYFKAFKLITLMFRYGPSRPGAGTRKIV